MNYLMIIGIGPVQEFIASARRSRDLWFGSWLLSELSKAAANAIVWNNNKELNSLIFPAPENANELASSNNTFSVANKIVACVDLAKWQGCSSLADVSGKIKDAIDGRLSVIKQDAFSHHRIPGTLFRSRDAELQVKDLVEFMWVAAPFDDDKLDYQAARELTEQLFAARKVTRNFNKVQWGRDVPKSSLDGQRESVIEEKAFERVTRNGRREYKLSDYEFRRDYGVRPGERLCGIGLLKRHGQRGNDNRIFSTSHVAVQPLLERLTAQHQEQVDEYIDLLKRSGADLNDHNKVPIEHPVFQRYDGHLLFKERLKEFIPLDKLPEAQAALADFFDKTKLPQPKPYYALLLADGDYMGKAIDEQKTPDDHRKLSRSLAEFAGVAPKIVRKYRGSLIYSGGDDVLAFVPLHTVLRCAKVLARCFRLKLRQFTVNENGQTKTPTLSVGIAVAHHLEPLQDALELARKAEKKAKSINGKNALAVIVDKRSGASRTVAGAWGTIDARLQRFVDWHYADVIPDGAAYQLRDLALRLESSEDIPDEEKRDLQKAMRYEAVRILYRKRAAHGREDVSKRVLTELKKMVQTNNTEQQNLSVAQLADELIIAKVFAEAVELAQPTEAEANG